jgi:hypothetical protein
MVDLDALERLHERAHKYESVHRCLGPFWSDTDEGSACGFDGESLDTNRDECGHRLDRGAAEFLVATLRALPDLLRELRAARKIVEAARAVDETYAGSYRGFALLADTVNGVNLSPIGPRFDALRAALSRGTTGGGE